MRIDQQAKHKKDHNLGEPRHSVENLRYAAVIGQRSVADYDATDIYGQIAITCKGGCTGKSEEYRADHED